VIPSHSGQPELVRKPFRSAIACARPDGRMPPALSRRPPWRSPLRVRMGRAAPGGQAAERQGVRQPAARRSSAGS